MILRLIPMLNNKKIILASASPRRLEILRSVGLQVEV
jgi:predicted house-cleaning NTP pyrophosphatase (Maf/HAM1 superfamily)